MPARDGGVHCRLPASSKIGRYRSTDYQGDEEADAQHQQRFNSLDEPLYPPRGFGIEKVGDAIIFSPMSPDFSPILSRSLATAGASPLSSRPSTRSIRRGCG